MKDNKEVREEIVTDKQLDKAWGYANFGSTPKRQVIFEALTKIVQGYHNGRTATVIAKELKLIEGREKDKYYVLTDKGLKYLLAKEYTPSLNSVEDMAKEYADSKERRGCSYWQGLYNGFIAGASNKESDAEEFLSWVAGNNYHQMNGTVCFIQAEETDPRNHYSPSELYQIFLAYKNFNK